MVLLKKKLAFAFAISLMLVACGDDDSSSGVNKSVGKISDADIEEATYDDLPACKSTNKDKSAYVVDEALTYVCDGKKWVSEEKIDSKSSSKELSSSSVEEKIFSSSSVEEKKMFQSSSSSSEEISSSSEEEIQSSTSTVSRSCVVDNLMYRVVHMSERSKPYIVLARNEVHTELDEAVCEIFTTFVTPQNDTLHYQTGVDIDTPASIGVPIDLTKSTINLVHVVRNCYLNSETTVTEYDSDCVLTSF